MAVDDVYTVQLIQTYAGQRIMNSLAFRMKSATDPTPVQFQSLADDWKVLFISQQSSTLSYVSWLAQQVYGGTVSYVADPCNRVGGRRLEGSYTGTVVGAGTAEGLPPQSAWVTTLKTDFAGRTHRGRHYLSGMEEAKQTNGTIAGAFVTAYQTAWDAQLLQYGPAGTDPNFQLGIWSMRTATGCVPRKEPPYGMQNVAPANPVQAFTPVTSFTVRNIVYSQRRRTIGVGV
jgi:hypothetical protein